MAGGRGDRVAHFRGDHRHPRTGRLVYRRCARLVGRSVLRRGWRCASPRASSKRRWCAGTSSASRSRRLGRGWRSRSPRCCSASCILQSRRDVVDLDRDRHRSGDPAGRGVRADRPSVAGDGHPHRVEFRRGDDLRNIVSGTTQIRGIVQARLTGPELITGGSSGPRVRLSRFSSASCSALLHRAPGARG